MALTVLVKNTKKSYHLGVIIRKKLKALTFTNLKTLNPTSVSPDIVRDEHDKIS
jgi:hypothetical protein